LNAEVILNLLQHSEFSIQHSDHQPQQSVLNLHMGHRQTACMRNISAPQRSHKTLLFPVRAQAGGVVDGFERNGCGRRFCGTGVVGSGIGMDYKLNIMERQEAREQMVAKQIAARGVTDPRVLSVMREVPRHVFVAVGLQPEAYEDRPLPIGEGQTISQPYMVAAMTAALEPRDSDHILEIGTGSGYQTAILARLARSVVSIERHPRLANRAEQLLASLGITNVRVTVGDGSRGVPAEAPYDRILVTAGAPAVPETLTDQLADGGRLVIPVGSEGYQRLMIIDRHGDRLSDREGEGCVFVPLIGQHGWPEGGAPGL
jgi:protein-L-isoaspartate(D-aspartate) O-methyltransferase